MTSTPTSHLATTVRVCQHVLEDTSIMAEIDLCPVPLRSRSLVATLSLCHAMMSRGMVVRPEYGGTNG